MTRLIRLGAAAAVLAAIGFGCNNATQSPTRSLRATPRGLPDAGGTTTVQVTATDEMGKSARER